MLLLCRQYRQTDLAAQGLLIKANKLFQLVRACPIPDSEIPKKSEILRRKRFCIQMVERHRDIHCEALDRGRKRTEGLH